jgi:hypothetical protein
VSLDKQAQIIAAERSKLKPGDPGPLTKAQLPAVIAELNDRLDRLTKLTERLGRRG